jgi:hypothetical protein
VFLANVDVVATCIREALRGEPAFRTDAMVIGTAPAHLERHLLLGSKGSGSLSECLNTSSHPPNVVRPCYAND